MRTLSVAICIPAYNEQQNIRKILEALLTQKTDKIHITKIVVVSSGSTDKTNKIVHKLSDANPLITLITQKRREGKSNAINAFLKTTDEPIVVVESADTIPEYDAIEKLCLPLVENEKIGMTGGAPVPINNRNTFIGYVVHSWWWFHRNIPRFGEIIAFRNILPEIAGESAVDEAYIQAKMVQKGYKVVHIDEAVVRNKGPESIADMIMQRRRIFNGHARLYKEEKVKIDNMTRSSLYLLLYKHKMKNMKEFIWTLGGLGIEVLARILGFYDQKIKNHNPFVWDTAKSTKNLSH
ncbi:hypothetical protein A3D77_04615 [Candidatus Gottesmanbacteria bacterium RIFCSPHIGHO2_02_FULL_39_11]|uniref:Glycosyltransferase 2-like domain-containing protein n=1 Tax=Candidatus Gottesmanbacteria bacterium RIFCSPHIGHO2_02_FULL_39_11 TaxID=1798382 RepID=A0A1F5ZKG7_9BACT|nr:MAG: hypothetical protein A3D77_04615 [Candidatus Gottesmanbacteria bacterium RIFCSPHIGHO2_02_FULL_39_11]